jgi:putative RNA 2'-phosphotransferase
VIDQTSMSHAELTALSKFLSFVLRHEPAAIGVELDANGWIAIDRLLAACATHGKPMTRAMLEEVVTTSPKQRFAISSDGLRIRASQGHSVEVDLEYEPAVPPDVLFHGTVANVVAMIRDRGLLKMARHHVHLSSDRETARIVATRRGAAVILEVAASRMNRDGHVFYRSANGVWLVEHVPPDYVSFPSA